MNLQLSLFEVEKFTQYPVTRQLSTSDPAWDDEEPPDPDDYPTLDDYETSWKDWEQKYPELIPETQVMGVREQVLPDTLNTVREQKLSIKSAPEHTHWIEEYWVKRCDKKYKYWRYCWMEGRKIKRCHLGGVRSRLAKQKKADVEVWMLNGLTPVGIEKLIRQQRNSNPCAKVTNGETH